MACIAGQAVTAQNILPGDLLFQVAGESSFSYAISASTASSNSLQFVHVAMVVSSEGNEIRVIEADPENGVQVTSLDSFLVRSPQINGHPGVVVKRITVGYPVETAINVALSHLREPYDWWYLPDNGKMYCSELIYESCRGFDGQPLFDAKPMNFRNPDGSIPEFWQELYATLGVPVPEGVPGTNPNDLSRSPLLSEVFKFF